MSSNKQIKIEVSDAGCQTIFHYGKKEQRIIKIEVGEGANENSKEREIIPKDKKTEVANHKRKNKRTKKTQTPKLKLIEPIELVIKEFRFKVKKQDEKKKNEIIQKIKEVDEKMEGVELEIRRLKNYLTTFRKPQIRKIEVIRGIHKYNIIRPAIETTAEAKGENDEIGQKREEMKEFRRLMYSFGNIEDWNVKDNKEAKKKENGRTREKGQK